MFGSSTSLTSKHQRDLLRKPCHLSVFSESRDMLLSKSIWKASEILFAFAGRKYFAFAMRTRSSMNSKRISYRSGFPSYSSLFTSKLTAMNSRSIIAVVRIESLN